MQAKCPICDVNLNLSKDLMESEVLECTDCHRKLVVKNISKGLGVVLGEAPVVEEDWGE